MLCSDDGNIPDDEVDNLVINSVTGWFVIDSVTYAGNVLNAIDLRFEMYRENSTAPLRGRVRWER